MFEINIAVGYELELRSDWKEWPPAFKSLKRKAEEIEADKVEKLSLFLKSDGSQLLGLPFYSRLSSVHLLVSAIVPSGTGPGSVTNRMEYQRFDEASAFSAWLWNYNEQFIEPLFNDMGRYTGDSRVHIWGYNPKRFLKVTGFDAIRLGRKLPVDLWIGNSDYRDIENVITAGEEISPGMAVRHLGCGHLVPESATDAVSQLLLTANLLARLGVFPTNCPDVLADMIARFDAPKPKAKK